MKVGIIHTTYLQKGGEDVVVDQEYQLLKSNNVPVSILYFGNPETRLTQAKSYLTSVFNNASYSLIKKWIDVEKPDVIHVHNWHYAASPAVFRAAKNKGIPVVHTLHNFRLLCPSGTLMHNNKLFLNSVHASFPWRAVRKKVYRNSYLQTFLLGFTVWFHKQAGTWTNIDKFIVLTNNAKNIFQDSRYHFNDQQISVKSNFIRFVEKLENVVNRKSHFLFVGRLSEEKGIITLLDAFAGSKYEIRIVGKGPLQHLVEEYSAKHNNIKYLGFQDQKFIIAELKICTAFIFPSIWYEGNPLTIIEAFACGTPVIASNIGAMQTMITHSYNGFHVAAGDVKDLSRTTEIWQNMSVESKESFYRNARNTYEECYTPQKNFEQLLSIYKSVRNGQN